jgi:hypothetical protein
MKMRKIAKVQIMVTIESLLFGKSEIKIRKRKPRNQENEKKTKIIDTFFSLIYFLVSKKVE